MQYASGQPKVSKMNYKRVEIIITDLTTGEVEHLVAPKVQDIGFKSEPPQRFHSTVDDFYPSSFVFNKYYDVYFGFRALPGERGNMFTLYKTPELKPTRKKKSRKVKQ